MSGKFIVFEGIDNSGKTTVSEKITEWLNKEYNIKSIITKHPGSTSVGQEIRQILKHSSHPINTNAQALLFAADNSLFMHQILKPSLEQDTWVIADRNNFISSLAYQIASGCSWDELDNVHDATQLTNKIDLLLIFKCDYAESQRRRALKNDNTPDRYEDAGKEYFDKLSKCYNTLIETQTPRLLKFVNICKSGEVNSTWDLPNAIYIDAMQPLEDVMAEVKNAIQRTLMQQ